MMRNPGDTQRAALSGVHRSQADRHHGLRTLSSGDGGGDGGGFVQARNEVGDSVVAARMLQLLVVAIGSDARSAVPKRVRSVHDADGGGDDGALCSTGIGPSHHAKRLEVRSSSDGGSGYHLSSHLLSLAHRPRAHWMAGTGYHQLGRCTARQQYSPRSEDQVHPGTPGTEKSGAANGMDGGQDSDDYNPLDRRRRRQSSPVV
jgi:hypothetical protein